MKAPDKIYLAESDNIRGEVTSNYASSIPFRRHDSITYIRKDALLEWAKEEQNKWEEYINKAKTNPELIRPVAFYSGAKSQIEDLIDKLNSM